jgi:sigma-E factor negative regulatory protein RseC
MEVEAINSAGALVGDRVLIAFETSSLMKASFLIYIFPILSMMLGGFTGQKISSFFNVDTPAMSVIGAFLFLIIAFLLVRLSGNQLAKREHYKPKIIRILKDK